MIAISILFLQSQPADTNSAVSDADFDMFAQSRSSVSGVAMATGSRPTEPRGPTGSTAVAGSPGVLPGLPTPISQSTMKSSDNISSDVGQPLGVSHGSSDKSNSLG